MSGSVPLFLATEGRLQADNRIYYVCNYITRTNVTKTLLYFAFLTHAQILLIIALAICIF